MAAIRDFFRKKKMDAKFKLAGEGHKLSEPAARSSSGSRGHHGNQRRQEAPNRSGPSQESSKAAAAAVARLEKKLDATNVNWSLSAIRAQAKRQMEAEAQEERSQQQQGGQRESQSPSRATTEEMAVGGVYFRCPLVGSEVLSRADMERRIREFLREQLQEERGLTSCLIIHSCNKGREKINTCVDTLCKYLDNLMQNPTEEKYRRIRLSNRAFQERVAPIEGSRDFLIAAGFEEKQEGGEDFMVFPEEKLEHLEALEILRDALLGSEPILPELDRCVKVLMPQQASARVSLPPEFFAMTPEEVKREQQARTEAVERGMVLRTKAMREREEGREAAKRYRYTLVRVRLPDGIVLQGTFGVYERVTALREFVTECLHDTERPFVLCKATGEKLWEADGEAKAAGGSEEGEEGAGAGPSLADLQLVPAALVNFRWEGGAQQGKDEAYLKPEMMVLLQPM